MSTGVAGGREPVAHVAKRGPETKNVGPDDDRWVFAGRRIARSSSPLRRPASLPGHLTFGEGLSRPCLRQHGGQRRAGGSDAKLPGG